MFTLAHNLYKWIKKKQEKSLTIILLGLDNAGKTTLLCSMKNDFPKGDKGEVAPTIGFRPSELISGKYTIKLFDVGGAKNFRRVWQNYYPEVHGIIYVVDGTDLDRIEEAKETLVKTLESDGIQGKPVLVFANKQDLEGCLAADKLSEKMGLLEQKDCRFHVAACQAKPSEKDGPVDARINKGLRWLLDAIDSDYTKLNTRVTNDTEAMHRKEKERKEEQKKRAEANKAARLKEQAEAEAAAAAAAPPPEPEKEPELERKPAESSHALPSDVPVMVVEQAEARTSSRGGSNKVTPSNNNTPVDGKGGGDARESPCAGAGDSADSSAVAERKSDNKVPTKLEIAADDAAPMPRKSNSKLPALNTDKQDSRSGSPVPKITALKPMPAIAVSTELQQPALPNSIPSPERPVP